MVAKLWAKKIMQGEKNFSQVPRLLKEQVKAILIENGREDLATEEDG